MTESTDTFMYALLWTCASCGFMKEGGQPKMECPMCAAYKTSFIALPQHLEREIRDTEGLSELPPNHKDCRAKRVAMIVEHDVKKISPVAGRVLPAASGNTMEN